MPAYATAVIYGQTPSIAGDLGVAAMLPVFVVDTRLLIRTEITLTYSYSLRVLRICVDQLQTHNSSSHHVLAAASNEGNGVRPSRPVKSNHSELCSAGSSALGWLKRKLCLEYYGWSVCVWCCQPSHSFYAIMLDSCGRCVRRNSCILTVDLGHKSMQSSLSLSVGFFAHGNSLRREIF